LFGINILPSSALTYKWCWTDYTRLLERRLRKRTEVTFECRQHAYTKLLFQVTDTHRCTAFKRKLRRKKKANLVFVRNVSAGSLIKYMTNHFHVFSSSSSMNFFITYFMFFYCTFYHYLLSKHDLKKSRFCCSCCRSSYTNYLMDFWSWYCNVKNVKQCGRQTVVYASKNLIGEPQCVLIPCIHLQHNSCL